MANDAQSARSNPDFLRLERQFFQLFGSDKDFFQYLSDPNYANSLVPIGAENSRSLSGAAVQASDTLASFRGEASLLAKTLAAGSAFEKIDLDPIFDPLRSDINAQAAQSLTAQKAAIGRESAGAQTRATEGLAGTGLGRSGVAAQQFSNISTRTQDLRAKATDKVEAARLAALVKIGYAQSQAEYKEALLDRNYTLQQINDALAFDRLLFQMQFQAELDTELAAAQNDGSWFDDLIGIATAALPFFPQFNKKPA